MRSFSARPSANLGVLNAATLLSSQGPSVSQGSDEVLIHITGTFVGTVSFQGSLDNVNWYPLKVEDAGTGAAVSSTTTPGAWLLRNDPPYCRAIMTAYTSGTAVVASTDVHIVEP